MLRTLCLLTLLIPAAALAEGPDLDKIDQLYLRRDDPAASKEEEALLADAVKQAPEDPQVLWRKARWLSWKADNTSGDAKKALGKEAWALGDKIAKLAPDMAEGPYYGALGIGQYSEAAGIINALMEGLEGKFNERLDKAIQMNPALNNGGPMSTKGRYFWSLPWPKRDLKKSAEWLTRCLAQHPENLRARVFLAQTLLAEGKPKEALAHVEQALTAEGKDPAEVARVRAMAKKVKAEIEKELK